MSPSRVVTPYYSVARYRNSQHLDNKEKIGKLICENRRDFENFVVALTDKAAANGVPDIGEIKLAIQLIEQAKDAFGRALIHSVGTCKVSWSDLVQFCPPWQRSEAQYLFHNTFLNACCSRIFGCQGVPFEAAVFASVQAASKWAAFEATSKETSHDPLRREWLEGRPVEKVVQAE